MDNEKGKKGKLFFLNIFITIYSNNYYINNKLFETELVMDNEKGKKR